MKTTPLTQGVSSLLVIIYVVYGFFALPFAGLLLSLAVGLLSYGALESVELSVAFVILTGVIFSLISRAGAASALLKVATKEGFATGNTDGTNLIAKRVERIYKANVGPHGVYASAFVEGFADSAEVDTQLEAVLKDKPTEESAESKPASATAPSTAGSGIPPPAPPTVASKVPKAETEEGVQGFRGAPDDGQFKLGVLPEEPKGGYHIDTGTTVMNALNALKPDQIQAMSSDTQKLIDTQKSLMSMLSSMKPMLQDGKQMMDTFQQMFGAGATQPKL